jgi:hypothetical protein
VQHKTRQQVDALMGVIPDTRPKTHRVALTAKRLPGQLMDKERSEGLSGPVEAFLDGVSVPAPQARDEHEGRRGILWLQIGYTRQPRHDSPRDTTRPRLGPSSYREGKSNPHGLAPNGF